MFFGEGEGGLAWGVGVGPHKGNVFFFSLEKIVSTHSSKSGKSCIFFSEGCIFFPETIFGFFSRKMYKLVQIPKSTQNSGAEKKNTARKKNTPFFLTHSILSENDTKVIMSKNKKKYGSFSPQGKKLVYPCSFFFSAR